MKRSNFKGWSMAHVERLKKEGKILSYTVHDIKPIESFIPEEQPKKKKSKYNNNKKEVDGIVFDSEREAARYGVLKLRRKAGEIGLLQLQVPYELNAGGTHSMKYVADFVYIETKTGKTIVEDVKSEFTATLPLFKKKKKLMKKLFKIEVIEII